MQAFLSGIISYRTVVDNSEKKLHYLPLKGHLRSPEVTNRHLPITFDQKEIETWIGVSTFVLDRRIDWYAIWPISVITWPWPDLTCGQTLTLTFQSHFIYGSTRFNETNTMVSNSLLYLKIKDLIVEKPFWKIFEFDPWRSQFWPEPKNDQNDFEMIFRELSNAAFCFSLRRPGAEIMGGAFKRPPPPPSRRWEIQRPSRARVKLQKNSLRASRSARNNSSQLLPSYGCQISNPNKRGKLCLMKFSLHNHVFYVFCLKAKVTV